MSKNLKVYREMPKKPKLTTRVIAGIAIFASLLSLSACSKHIDGEFNHNNAVILNNGNSVVMPIVKWKDDKGETIEVITNDGMAILTSSYLTSLVSGQYGYKVASDYAKSMTDKNGTLSFYSEDVASDYQTLDFQKNFDKAVIFQNNNAVVVPVAKWNDYSGQQIQIITPENVVILTSDYNAILVADSKSSRKAVDLAYMLVGKNGKVTDLAGNYEYANFNKQIIDLKQAFNKALLLGDNSNCILPLKSWTDYDGEQFQIKIMDGPIFVCSSFNTLLINDIHGENVTAEVISKALNGNLVNYSKGIEFEDKFYNKQTFDFDNSFQNALINNGSYNVTLPVKSWCDYDGEQLQFVLPNDVTILSSSIDSNMSNHCENKITIDSIAKSIANNSNNLDPNYKKTNYNKTFFDTKWSFPYALVVNDNSIIILSINEWCDYPGGEQFRLTLADKETTILTTAYDTKLVSLGKSNLSIYDIVNYFNDGSKKIVDLTNGLKGDGKHIDYPIIGTPHPDLNYAIAINGDVATIIPLENYSDFNGETDGDGNYTDYCEQIEIAFNDGNIIYSDSVKMKLVKASNIDIVKQIALGYISYNGTINILGGSQKVLN